MNPLLTPEPRGTRRRGLSAVLSFFYAVAHPTKADAGEVLWQGSVEDIRQGARLKAKHPDAVPDTDEGMADLLAYARPALRQHGFTFTRRRTTVTVRSARNSGRKPGVSFAPLSVADAARQTRGDALKTHPKMSQTAAGWKRW